ncbi:hypothetical protein [Massilia litorea]|uniref:Uncharacterized protein n=1 Tax=Massilia litorea TaxID=2769491 RepID=A0A7L9U5M2_9BURK|nr:hypothetical protein [Massilia litorea]QOL50237.1 hypothetical protein LPB04_02675 [Massilia litorea]
MHSNQGGCNVSNDASASEEVELALGWHDADQQWQVHWRVPPFREGTEVVLERDGASWKVPVWGTERCSTVLDTTSGNVAAARTALEESATRNVHFKARLEEDGTAPASLGMFALPKAELRVLAWGTDYASQHEELQEQPLPRHGCAYLLAAPRVARQLLWWLEHEHVKHQMVDSAGLPPDWVLACLTDCGLLTEAQVGKLPGSVATNGIHRLLAIVGGRSISRASKRQYLSYDLPSIELDAPPGTTLQTDQALTAEEISSSVPGRKTGVRRFRLLLRDTAQKLFRITAVLGNRELGSATLRIAPDSGEQITLGRDFSLDPQGRPQPALSGLRGTLADASPQAAPVQTDPRLLTVDSLGHPSSALTISKHVSSPAALFLDSLARQGSMAYGTAKDQLARLLARNDEEVRADKVLLDLRCRGHVEIETSTKGHFTRVHAVPPTLYRLPLVAGGQPVCGILGTLLQQQWRTLFEQAGADVIHCDPPTAGLLPALRILVRDEASAARIAMAAGMASLPPQSVQIASWAATCEDVIIQIENGAVESIGALEHHPQRLHAGSGCFKDASSLAPQSGCDLFRMDDRDIIGGRVYVLATRKENITRYGFVRDSRWGVWIALRAFARFMEKNYSIDDACPWPIPYSDKDRTLFVPARISLPVVLERALVLCSGQAPDIAEADGHSVAGKLVIARRSDGKWLVATSHVYSDMANGRWLLYRSVPRDVAVIVAGKLGAALAIS